ncbi:MAG TPA: hypothetical protein VMU41_04175 [Candidatus Binataceae bacterium]|nr:hypothetical protein [Candidatus Binataceae bacterium]
MRQGQNVSRDSRRAIGERFRTGARRSSDVTAAVMRISKLRYQLFRDRFGRDPYPDEPLFFDPSNDVPVVAEVSQMWTQVMDAAVATRTDALSVMKFLGLA